METLHIKEAAQIARIDNQSFLILQARKVQLCISSHDKCLSKEVLKNEIGDGEEVDNRFLINPEFVQSLDKSDGSKAFDFNGEGTDGFD